jgi:hypothetical protein
LIVSLSPQWSATMSLLTRRAFAATAVAGLAHVVGRRAESAELSPFAPALAALQRRAASLRPTAADLRYQQIPWQIDLAEGVRAARTEKRPLFLWAAGGRDRDGLPLERC